MRWKTGRRSQNVEDRRGMRISSGKVKGGSITIIVLALIGMYFGIDPSVILNLNQVGQPPVQQQTPYTPSAAENQLADFVSVVLADTEDTWEPIFNSSGWAYEKPKLVLFSGAVKSACGFARAAVGPFYCPADKKIYIDLAFYSTLKNKLNAPGDFAQAYVIAHEVGHHVQNLIGLSSQVQNQRGSLTQAEYNKLSVKLELQADCFAGVWANHAQQLRNILEPGDLEEALNAASMIGDDQLQKQAKGYVVPDSFTHGTSEQRVSWFRKGFDSGKITQCNTFK